MIASPNLIRILAVDDHPIFRQGITGLLADQPDMKLATAAFAVSAVLTAQDNTTDRDSSL